LVFFFFFLLSSLHLDFKHVIVDFKKGGGDIINLTKKDSQCFFSFAKLYVLQCCEFITLTYKPSIEQISKEKL